MKFFKYVFLCFCLAFLVGCPDPKQIQAQTANTIAIAANTSLPVLIDEYKQQGVHEITLSKNEEDATSRLLVIEKKWQPIWKAWETLRVAHDAWASIIEGDGDAVKALLALKDAYCGLMKVWPVEIRAIPMAGVACGVTK
ncbi:MAG: hypothetical protein PHC68_04190 [Syntrophorhabdaceae bacterium]|nr:hypothetical protein [Syntrophorhabdaceae bacterium]